MNGFCYCDVENECLRIRKWKIGNSEQKRRERKVKKLNPLLSFLDPCVASHQLSLNRALSIYNECRKIGSNGY